MLVGSKQNCGVTSDPLDWIILRSVWASWKWPRAAHWSWRNQRRGSSCHILEGISAALSHLLRVNASQKPGGLSQLRLALHRGGSAVFRSAASSHSWENHSSGSSLRSSPVGSAESLCGMAEGNSGSHLGHCDWHVRPGRETPSIPPHSHDPSSPHRLVLHLWGRVQGRGQEDPWGEGRIDKCSNSCFYFRCTPSNTF